MSDIVKGPGAWYPAPQLVKWLHDQMSYEESLLPHVLWGPERIRAECAAKRLIIEACLVNYRDWLNCDDDGGSEADDVLRAVALPYAHRPGYLEEWRP